MPTSASLIMVEHVYPATKQGILWSKKQMLATVIARWAILTQLPGYYRLKNQ